MRRALRAVSTVLIVAGTLMLADVALTLLWQEPVSALLARLSQDQLEDDLSDLEEGWLSGADRRGLDSLSRDSDRLAYAARALRRRTQPGDAIGRIEMPSLGLERVMVEGTRAGDLREGPGHYEDTSLPGLPGTTAVAGHRTTFGAPFNEVDELDRGDPVRLEMPYATFVYRVERSRIVSPADVEVLEPAGYARLVLSSCHPKYSDAKRIVVFARLARAEPGPELRPAP